MPTPQARYWLLTIPSSTGWVPILNDPICYLKGQKERGDSTGYEHFQVLCVCSRRVTIRQLKVALVCPSAHCETSRSSAANDYVWKEDTRVPGTQFELGTLPVSRARTVDWNAVYFAAVDGSFDNIPKDILIRNYTSLKRIRVDNCKPPFRPDVFVRVYWGPTGTGKTHRCFAEAGENFFVKNSRTKWWDGYQGQPNVIIDEFAGSIDVTYLLNWFDKYPCFAEVKGFTIPLQAINFWVTSNIDPKFWYGDITLAHRDALLRRLTVVEEMTEPYIPTNLTNDPVTPPNSPNLNPNLTNAPRAPRRILTSVDLENLLNDDVFNEIN